MLDEKYITGCIYKRCNIECYYIEDLNKIFSKTSINLQPEYVYLETNPRECLPITSMNEMKRIIDKIIPV